MDLISRLKEPSTGAAIAALVALFAPPQVAQLATEGTVHATALVGVAGALWGIFAREGR